MTLQEIRTLHAYNAWANNRIFEAVAALPPEQYLKDMKSSHGGIHGTLVHLVGAEKVWLGRWQGREDPFMTTADALTLKALREAWQKNGFETAKFLGTLTDQKLQGTFTMKTMKGETFEHILWQTIQHLVDHSTYHRGQVITLMRQLSVTPPSTGLIRFYRETARR
jgi:uncharacterized damage-inducible protein DinB